MTDEPKRITVEDIFHDGDLFGFRVKWSVQDHWSDVTVWEITGEDENGKLLFNAKDWQSLPQHVESVEDAQEYLSGYIKWDGCSELDQGCPHWCGPPGYKYHIALLEYLYRRAFELMGCEPEEKWEEYETPKVTMPKEEGDHEMA